jgi:hypothetical protein
MQHILPDHNIYVILRYGNNSTPLETTPLLLRRMQWPSSSSSVHLDSMSIAFIVLSSATLLIAVTLALIVLLLVRGRARKRRPSEFSDADFLREEILRKSESTISIVPEAYQVAP